MILNISRTTMARKLIFVGSFMKAYLEESAAFANPTVHEMQFDDLETIHHTKLKPLSITLAVESGSRRILGFEVSPMRAKGQLAKLSFEKYGKREDGRKVARRKLLNRISSMLVEGAIIKSDKNPHYGLDVAEIFPKSEHQTFKGRRGCVTGQGELKQGGFDPLFSLNHTCAMFRANINRLFRRTWCTTKSPERLSFHIAMYIVFHNFLLLKTADR